MLSTLISCANIFLRFASLPLTVSHNPDKFFGSTTFSETAVITNRRKTPIQVLSIELRIGDVKCTEHPNCPLQSNTPLNQLMKFDFPDCEPGRTYPTILTARIQEAGASEPKSIVFEGRFRSDAIGRSAGIMPRIRSC